MATIKRPCVANERTGRPPGSKGNSLVADAFTDTTLMLEASAGMIAGGAAFTNAIVCEAKAGGAEAFSCVTK
jgi:hypothetical protein